MANITFSSETYNAFLEEKKCCIATQVSEYVDAMYSASSDADCLLDELRENVYYVKFLESGYIPIGNSIYAENGTCYYTSKLIFNFTPQTIYVEDNTIYWYNQNGVLQNKQVYFTNISGGFWPPGSLHGNASQLQSQLISFFTGLGYYYVDIKVTFINNVLNFYFNVDDLIFYYVNNASTLQDDYDFNYTCDYVYASEDTNCITDDDAIKLSNLIHCDCCD